MKAGSALNQLPGQRFHKQLPTNYTISILDVAQDYKWSRCPKTSGGNFFIGQSDWHREQKTSSGTLARKELAQGRPQRQPLLNLASWPGAKRPPPPVGRHVRRPPRPSPAPGRAQAIALRVTEARWAPRPCSRSPGCGSPRAPESSSSPSLPLGWPLGRGRRLGRAAPGPARQSITAGGGLARARAGE